MAKRSEHAAKMWQILVEYAKNRRYLTYGELSEAMGAGAPPARALGPILEYILRYTRNKGLFALSGIAVMKSTGEPNENSSLTKLELSQLKSGAVFDYNWKSVTPPTEAELDTIFRQG
jgi:hypothetical protein